MLPKLVLPKLDDARQKQKNTSKQGDSVITIFTNNLIIEIRVTKL